MNNRLFQSFNPASPTYLLTTKNNSEAQETIITFLKQHLCKEQNEFCGCADCRTIDRLQHQSLIWFAPEQEYLVGTLDPLFQRIQFQQQSSDKFFFILENIERLNTFTANKLLKVLEEPPAGYYFILTTRNRDRLLDTIISRSVVVNLASDESDDYHSELKNNFLKIMRKEEVDLAALDKLLNSEKLGSTESIDLAEKLLAVALKERHQTAAQIIAASLKKLPQPGGALLFLRQLVMDLYSN